MVVRGPVMRRYLLDGAVPWSAVTKLIAGVTAGALLLAGCTTTTAGHGTAAAANEHPFSVATSAPTVSSSPTGSSQPVPTTTAPSTTAPTTTAPTTTAPTTTAPAGPGPVPTKAQLAAQLTRLTPGKRRVIVTLVRRTGTPAVAEAATYDQAGHVTFWRYSTSWLRAGTSSYPYDRAFVGRPSAVITGAVLTGMTHATFIARGFFSGDGSGNAVAFTTGAKGWGAIKAENNGNIGPSGQGVGFSAKGLSEDFEFTHGLLETADCSDTLPIAACGGNQRVLKFWRWAGHDFVLHSRAGLSH